MKTIDLLGKKFGRLLVLERKGSIGKRPLWLCQCDCGQQKICKGEDLRYGVTKSCGCLAKEMAGNRFRRHGMTWGHFWTKWYAIRQRCLNENSSTYYKYGAKGISVCERWNKFEAFKEDMYASYLKHVEDFGEKNTTIDRFPNQFGNYEPNNCRWATNKQQARNKTNNRLLEFKGETHSIVEWSEITGITQDAIERRINLLKWSVEKALTIPVRKRRKLALPLP